MRSIRLVPWLAALLLLATGALVAACGGGDGGGASAEDYFKELQSLSDEVDNRFNAAFEEFGPALDPSASEETTVEQAPKFAEEVASIATFAREGLEDLDPPSDVKEAHDAFTAAVTEFEESLRDLIDDLEGVDSAAEMESLFNSPELDAADNNVTKTCEALQQAATSKGIEVDLNCED